jgi:glycosyltransferase involved in cell wall biosynthesis
MTELLELTKGLDRGGMERILVDIALHRQRNGQAVRVVVINGTRRSLAEELEAGGIRVQWLPGSDRIGWRGLRSLAEVVRQAPATVLHAHGPWPIVLAAVLRRGDQRTVGTIHAVWADHRLFSRVAMLAVAGRLDALSTVSDAAHRSLPRRLRRTASVIPHGVTAEEHVAAQPEPTWDVAVIASHRPAKGYPVLLEALAAAGRHLHVVAVGDGPDRSRHQAMAERLGLGEMIDWQPSTDDPRAVLRRSRVCVIASTTESQPLVALEALVCGVPVIGSEVGRIPELLADGGGVVVRRNDRLALAKAIDAMLTAMDDPPTAERWRNEARRAAGAWPLEAALHRYDALFDSLTGAR